MSEIGWIERFFEAELVSKVGQTTTYVPSPVSEQIKMNYSQFLKQAEAAHLSGEITPFHVVRWGDGSSLEFLFLSEGMCLVVIRDMALPQLSTFSIAGYCVAKVRLHGEFVESHEGYQLEASDGDCVLVASGHEDLSWQISNPKGKRLTSVNLIFHPESFTDTTAEVFLPQLARLFESAEATEPSGHFVNLGISGEILRCAREIVTLDRESPMFLLKVKGMVLQLLADLLIQLDRQDIGSGVQLATKDIERLEWVKDRIETEHRESLTLDQLAAEAGLNRRKLTQGFKALFGSSVMDYALERRMFVAEKLIREGRPMSVIADTVGYHDQGNFSRAFKRFYGVSPRAYKQHLH